MRTMPHDTTPTPQAPSYVLRLRALARRHRMVFIAGLPGVGKSLLLREMAEAAHGRGRRVFLLQWDVARRPFDAPALLARFPETDGITHPVLRKAAGLWALDAVAAWAGDHADDDAMLVGEAPLIGHRFAELARPSDGAAETALRSASTLFLLPVPTVEVRRVIEAARAETTARPRHRREMADAPPNVLRLLWGELLDAAAQCADARGLPPPADVGYDPDTYVSVFSVALSHRNWEPLPIDVPLPSQERSVYDLRASAVDLAPSEAEAAAYAARVERAYPYLAALHRETAAWWRP